MSLQPDFYNKLNVKNWDLTLIKTGLKVNENGYNAIYAVLEEELINQNLFGLKLNTVARKRQLECVLENVIQRFPDIFNSIPSKWTRKCLEALARKCNTNERRRLPAANLSLPINSESNAALNERLSPPSSKQVSVKPQSKCIPPASNQFGNTMVFVRRYSGKQNTIFQPRDLMLEDKKLEDISANDLQFNIFISMLQEEIAYDRTMDTIVYQCSDEDKVEIKNERAWKAALSEMFCRGSSRFTFDVERDQERVQQENCMTFQNALECDRVAPLIVYPAHNTTREAQCKRKRISIARVGSRKKIRGSQ